MKNLILILIIVSACQPSFNNYTSFRKTIYQDKDDRKAFIPVMMEVAKGRYKVDSNQTLSIGNFYISKYQVTTNQFAYFLNQTMDSIKIPKKEYIESMTIIDSENAQLYFKEGKILVKNSQKFQPMVNVNYLGTKTYSKWLTGLQDTLFNQQRPSKIYYWKHYNFRIPYDYEWKIAFSCFDSLSTKNLLKKPSNFKKRGLQEYKNQNFDIVSTHYWSNYNLSVQDSTNQIDTILLYSPTINSSYNLETESAFKKSKNIGFRVAQQSSYSNSCGCDSWDKK